jgi:hypothetical protein
MRRHYLERHAGEKLPVVDDNVSIVKTARSA